jgi:hypothetical protein
VWKKNLTAIFRSGDPQPLSTAAWSRSVESGCAEAPARGPPDCYDSTVCSIEGGALRRVAEAIDQLEADRENTDAADLEARIAAVWSMVTEIDPELARLASGYRKPR